MVATLKNLISNEAVDTAIAAFKASLGASKTAAQAAAVAALNHCYQHRTASKLRDMLATIETEGKDFVRRAPFTLWLRAYAPVKMVEKEVEGKKVKVLEFDKESTLLANADDAIATASGKLWWTMSKDKEPSAFDLIDFHKKLLALANRAYNAAEEEENDGSAVLAHIAGFVQQFDLLVRKDKAVANAAAAAASTRLAS